MNLLLDPVVLIDHFKGVEAATACLAQHHADCALSVITRAEVLAGFGERDTAAVAAGLLTRIRPSLRRSA